MTVYIHSELYNQLIQHSMDILPDEACGFITGRLNSCSVETVSFIPLRNHARNPRQHFEMNPQEFIPYLMDMHNPVIGLFHSHPTAPPIPSTEDLETLWHTIPTYWILSLQDKLKPILQIYQIKKAAPTSFNKLSFVIGQ